MLDGPDSNIKLLIKSNIKNTKQSYDLQTHRNIASDRKNLSLKQRQRINKTQKKSYPSNINQESFLNKSQLKTKSKYLNSTCIQDSKADILEFNCSTQNAESFIKTQNKAQSKCKSQIWLKNSSKVINIIENSNPTLIPNNRLFKNTKCLKHQPLFDEVELFKQNKNSRLSYGFYDKSLFNINNPSKSNNKNPSKSNDKNLSKINISKQDKFERLIQDLRYKQLKRFQSKSKQSKQLYQNSCTFIPNIHSQSSNISHSQSTQIFHTKIHQRLFKQAFQIKQKLKNNQTKNEQKQKQLIKKFNEQAIKRKQENKKKWQQLLISETNKQNFNKPFYKRIHQTIDKKRQFMNQLTQKYNHPQQKTKITLNTNQTNIIVKRLVDDYLNTKNQKLIQIQQQQMNKFKQTHTFMPETNHNLLLDQNYKDQFSKRQVSITNTFSFQPKINNMSKIIANYLNLSKPDHQYYENETSKLTQKMYQGNFTKKQQNIEKIDLQVYKECTFIPQINQISRKMAYQYCEQNPQQLIRHKCPIAESVIETQKQLTFQPQINIQSKFMSLQVKQKTLLRNKQKSRQRLKQITNQKQYQQIQECTFQPKTISTSNQWQKWKVNHLQKQLLIGNSSDKTNYPQNTSNYTFQVKGMDKFMQNCARIHTKKQLQQDRAQQVFNFEKKYDKRMKKQQEQQELQRISSKL